jgi:hypothetical protein
MKPETPETKNNPPDSEAEVPKPKKARAKKLTAPVVLAGGKPATKVENPTEQLPDRSDATSQTMAAPAVPSAGPEKAAGGPSRTENQASTARVGADATAAIVTGTPAASKTMTADDVQAAFEADCGKITRRIVAHEIAFALGWYPIADATADLRDRYKGRLQNIAPAIAAGLGRSERFVYIMFSIAKHPPELRGRAEQVGLLEDQGRLAQLQSLDADDRERALQAFGEGGPKAFDAIVGGTSKIAERAWRDETFAAFLGQIANPKETLGGIAEKAPNEPVPEAATKQFPELEGMTYGDVVRAAAQLKTPKSAPTPSGGGKGGKNRERDWQKGFDLDVAAEKTVNLRKAEFTLVLVHVIDADGNEIKGAKAKVQVLDRT